MCMKVSIRDISRKTGFSPATVSNALNHKRGVNKETAAKVFQVAKEMGYINEDSISKIKFVIFKRNGSIIEDTPFFQSLINGCEQECRRKGYEMVICNVDQRDQDYETQVKEMLRDSASAFVLLGTEMMDDDLKIFKNARTPLVLLDYWSEDMELNGVLINNADSARMATEYLIRKGHTKVGYIRGSYRIKGFRSRAIGYQTAMRKEKLEIPDDYVLTVSTTMNGAYHDMLCILDKKLNMPTAFVVDNDMIALGVMKALQERGYRIPEDISLIGFDDLPFSEISFPPLTTLRVPKQEMGKLAAQRVIELIQNPTSAVTKTQVCTTFVERQTVKQLRDA